MKEFLDELKNIHRRFSKFEFAIVIIFILFVLFIPYKPNIIGFSEVNVHKQTFNLAVDKSRSFVLQAKMPVLITSLSISGEVLGPGSASVYLLDKEGKKHKVFSNEQKGMSLVTGFFGDENELANTIALEDPILEIKETSLVDEIIPIENSVPGEFFSVCSDTCIINEESGSFELVAYVDSGTTLIIKEIDYTTINR